MDLSQLSQFLHQDEWKVLFRWEMNTSMATGQTHLRSKILIRVENLRRHRETELCTERSQPFEPGAMLTKAPLCHLWPRSCDSVCPKHVQSILKLTLRWDWFANCCFHSQEWTFKLKVSLGGRPPNQRLIFYSIEVNSVVSYKDIYF